MSYWDSATQTVVRIPPERIGGYPGWVRLDCGCCDGIEWGGDEPQDCYACKGYGSVCLHVKSGVIALYPGGPLCGHATDDEQEAAAALLAKESQ